MIAGTTHKSPRKGHIYAVLPDGTYSTRKTDRDYRYAVAVVGSHDADKAAALELAGRYDARADRLEALIADPSIAESYEAHQAAVWGGNAAGNRKNAAAARSKAAKIGTGTYYVAISYHARHDLALKAVAKRTAPYTIVEVITAEELEAKLVEAATDDPAVVAYVEAEAAVEASIASAQPSPDLAAARPVSGAGKAANLELELARRTPTAPIAVGDIVIVEHRGNRKAGPVVKIGTKRLTVAVVHIKTDGADGYRLETERPIAGARLANDAARGRCVRGIEAHAARTGYSVSARYLELIRARELELDTIANAAERRIEDEAELEQAAADLVAAGTPGPIEAPATRTAEDIALAPTWDEAKVFGSTALVELADRIGELPLGSPEAKRIGELANLGARNANRVLAGLPAIDLEQHRARPSSNGRLTLDQLAEAKAADVAARDAHIADELEAAHTAGHIDAN